MNSSNEFLQLKHDAKTAADFDSKELTSIHCRNVGKNCYLVEATNLWRYLIDTSR